MTDQLPSTDAIHNTDAFRRAGEDAGVDLPVDIDLKALAEEVFKLMKEDLRRERERQGKP